LRLLLLTNGGSCGENTAGVAKVGYCGMMGAAHRDAERGKGPQTRLFAFGSPSPKGPPNADLCVGDPKCEVGRARARETSPLKLETPGGKPLSHGRSQ
jgi:hypothetical protein